MIIVDTETTGTDWRHHGLVSIGAVDFDNPENEFYGECRVFDGAHIEPGALAVNGFTEEEVRNPQARSEKELVEAFFAWAARVGDRTIAGANPSFDRDFIRAVALRNHLDWPFAYRTVDLHSVAYAIMLAKGHLPPSKNGHSDLDVPKILAYCGIPTTPRAHHAQDDALYEAEAFSRLIYGVSAIEDLEPHPIPAHLKR